MSTTANPASPMAAAARDVIVASDAWAGMRLGGRDALAIAQAAMEAAAQEIGLGDGVGWALLLADDAALRQLNRDHRGKDQPTNVLSFPAFARDDLPAAGHIGDVAIAAETVAAEALDAGKPALHHLAHMVAHGIAHLAGYDHADDPEAEEMEAIEVRALARLGLPDPYASEALAG